MHWFILIFSGAFEAVWAVALSKSEGFSRLIPSIVFVLALGISMGGLGWALKEIPVGTGYAVWVGIGAATAATYSMATGMESASLAKILLLIGLVGCVIGLKFVSGTSE